MIIYFCINNGVLEGSILENLHIFFNIGNECSLTLFHFLPNSSIMYFILNERVLLMNKTELIAKVAEATELTKKDSTKAVDAIFEAIAGALQNGEKVSLIGFGNFEVRERAARKGRNPQTGEEIEIASAKLPAFKPGKELKEIVK